MSTFSSPANVSDHASVRPTAPWLTRLLATEHDVATTVARLTLGLVMFPHGAQKALGMFGGYGFGGTMGFMTGKLGIPAPFAVLAIAAEFLGALGLLTGALSRIAAFGVGVVMIVAVVMVHAGMGFFMNWTGTQAGEGFEYHLLALGLALVVMLRGGGAWSLDRLLVSRGARTSHGNHLLPTRGCL